MWLFEAVTDLEFVHTQCAGGCWGLASVAAMRWGEAGFYTVLIANKLVSSGQLEQRIGRLHWSGRLWDTGKGKRASTLGSC